MKSVETNIRIVCVYTEQYSASLNIANRCVQSGADFGYHVELYPSVYWEDMDRIHESLGLTQKYTPVAGTNQTTTTSCPAGRMANGTTHYMLYVWCVEHNRSLCILEHDAVIVGTIPAPIVDGIIQISSHCNEQADEGRWRRCNRANKMRRYEPNRPFVWDTSKEIRQHPLSGANGTSGYVIHPGAAQRMVDYIKHDGIAYADRMRTEHIGEGNLHLQVPQSVICDHKVKTAIMK